MLRKIAALAAVLVLAAGCGSLTQNANTAESDLVNRQQAQYEKAQPVHFYDFSMQRQLMIDIYDSQNQDQQTWTVVTSMTGAVIFQCESRGWPIPAAAQLTNPQTVQTGGSQGSSGYWGVTVGQAEPNGLYTGNTAGTYFTCIRPDGKISVLYSENNVTMFPFPVKVGANGVIEDAGGASNITVTLKSGGAGRALPAASATP